MREPFIRRVRPATAAPAVLLVLAAGAFTGLAILPAVATAPTLSAGAVTVAAPTVIALPQQVLIDLPRASRSRPRLPVAAPSPSPRPSPTVAPKPKPARPLAAARSTPPPAPPAVLRRAVGGVCPVPAAHFTDTWGAPRPGGRRHMGTDLLAPLGSPVYAVADGVVDTTYSGSGGISLFLRATDGERFYYAHNSKNLVADGARVRAGDLIAQVGNTGDASGGETHVHFERAPDGRATVNAYSFLRSICGGGGSAQR